MEDLLSDDYDLTLQPKMRGHFFTLVLLVGMAFISIKVALTANQKSYSLRSILAKPKTKIVRQISRPIYRIKVKQDLVKKVAAGTALLSLLVILYLCVANHRTVYRANRNKLLLREGVFTYDSDPMKLNDLKEARVKANFFDLLLGVKRVVLEEKQRNELVITLKRLGSRDAKVLASYVNKYAYNNLTEIAMENKARNEKNNL